MRRRAVASVRAASCEASCQVRVHLSVVRSLSPCSVNVEGGEEDAAIQVLCIIHVSELSCCRDSVCGFQCLFTRC